MDKVTVQFWTYDGKYYAEHTRQVYADSFLDDVLWHIENHNKHHGTTWTLHGKPFIAVM